MTVASNQYAVYRELDGQSARGLTDKIRAGLEGVYQLIIQAYQGRAWIALGYGTWDEYIRREFGNQPLRPPLEERTDTVQSMRDAGMSTRAIAAATQLSKGTVGRELEDSGAPNGAPEPQGSSDARPKIQGIDGKAYLSSTPQASPSVNDADSSVLDAPAESAGVQALDSEEIGKRRSERAEKILDEFHGSDVAALHKTMFLAEKVGGLVSQVTGDIDVDEATYADVAKDVAAAIRQFAYVAKTLAGARAAFTNRKLLDVVIDDLGYATEDLVSTVTRMEGKKQ